MKDKNPADRLGPNGIRKLLARAPMIQSACELDLLGFLHRHPRALLTNEQLAAFAGYDMKQVAQTIDAFIGAGVLERTQNPNHAARMYLLVLDGPRGGDLKALIEVASTRQGRREIVEMLAPRPSQTRPVQITDIKTRKRLHAIA